LLTNSSELLPSVLLSGINQQRLSQEQFQVHQLEK
jgi:hypothetical protein